MRRPCWDDFYTGAGLLGEWSFVLIFIVVGAVALPVVIAGWIANKGWGRKVKVEHESIT